jgi:hypothetical protein
MTENSRYAGKPMLRLLECYVLWTIGKLERKEEEALGQMEPKLRQVFNRQGSWREIVSNAMDLPTNLPDLIRTKWNGSLEIDKQGSAALTPQQFAEMFVDTNLVGEKLGQPGSR